MKTELIQALSNANINSDSAEIVASKYISYLYFSELISNLSGIIGVCSCCAMVYFVFKLAIDTFKES